MSSRKGLMWIYNNKWGRAVSPIELSDNTNVLRNEINVSYNNLSDEIKVLRNKIKVYTAGAGINIANNVISANTYSVGDFAHGGIVFWVDETGRHGLVCTKQDQSTGACWKAEEINYLSMAKGDGPFAGKMNTAIIIAHYGYGDGSVYAARICGELQITEGGRLYGDWYLPSIAELHLMSLNKTVIDVTAIANDGSAFVTEFYWSSTEMVNNLASGHHFSHNSPGGHRDKKDKGYVRAVRAF